MLYVNSFNPNQSCDEYIVMTCMINITNISHTWRPGQSLDANPGSLAPET